MGVGMMVGGIILLILGIVAFSYGSSLKSRAEQGLAECQSISGQAGQFLSPDVSQKCQQAQHYAPATQAGYYIGIAFAFVGIGVAIAGAARPGRRGRIEKI
jgi:hypothetical protein